MTKFDMSIHDFDYSEKRFQYLLNLYKSNGTLKKIRSNDQTVFYFNDLMLKRICAREIIYCNYFTVSDGSKMSCINYFDADKKFTGQKIINGLLSDPLYGYVPMSNFVDEKQNDDTTIYVPNRDAKRVSKKCSFDQNSVQKQCVHFEKKVCFDKKNEHAVFDNEITISRCVDRLGKW